MSDDLATSAPVEDACSAAIMIPMVYDELRRLAAVRLAGEQDGDSFQSSALVHEAYLRLAGPAGLARWNGPGHFFAAAAVAMRRILIERARARVRDKHGGRWRKVDLTDGVRVVDRDPAHALAVNEALGLLREEDPLTASLVGLHVFMGCSIAEAGRSLGLSRTAAYERWGHARAWLGDALRELVDGG